MKAIDLNGVWRMKSVTADEWIDAAVPGTVFGALLDAGMVEDPYYRDNELKVTPVFEQDYEYSRTFTVGSEVLAHDQVMLCCEGLDTIASISINGNTLADTDNMHRTYRFDVRGMLDEGINTIHILFRSPVAFAKEMADKHNRMGLMGGRGIEFIRKAQCMFGWDWGLVLPDSGIWRDIYIECYDAAEIREVHILQDHKQGEVALDIRVDCAVWAQKDLALSVAVTSPDGEKLSAEGPITAVDGDNHASIAISDPQLWWPNGFGDQPLYQVDVRLADGDTVLDERRMRIGLRTIRLRREEDAIGKSYEFVVNGNAIFMKGSNLIIEDALLGRRSRERTEKMIKSCADANFNCIRIWGGANYPEDYFYDLCDQYGIILYHDLMFACNFYPADDAFLDNTRKEVVDNVKRARHHACIGLWSGNNEIEVVFQLAVSDNPAIAAMRKQFGMPEMEAGLKKQIYRDYQKIFCEVVPDLLAKIDPQTDYVPTSPLEQDSGKEPGDTSLFSNALYGDAHYYVAYDNIAPYPTIRDRKFRFVSEMGFQSYPSYKTIQDFTLPEDRKPDSPVMLSHQKCNNGNPIIEAYMGQDYAVPGDFTLYVYESQILAGEIQRYAVEHFRRHIGLCMGVITWQLNDCWPAVSWAGLDYNGRWKAQQYYTKRFYAPILVSALDQGMRIDLWVNNDTLCDIKGTVEWKLMDKHSKVVESDSIPVEVASGKAAEAVRLDFSGRVADPSERYVEFAFVMDGDTASSGAALFVKPKDFHFADPEIGMDVTEEDSRFIVTLKSAAFAKSVALDLKEADCIFSDNYFDLSANCEKRVEAAKESLSQQLTLADFTRQLTVQSVFDIK